jgi:hypothetical protein
MQDHDPSPHAIGSVLFLGAMPPLIGTHFTPLEMEPGSPCTHPSGCFLVRDKKSRPGNPHGVSILGLCPMPGEWR